MKKVYLLGNVTNGGTATPEQYRENYGMFCRFEKLLQQAGYEVVNPVKLISEHVPWPAAMKITIAAMMECDAIFPLPNWKESRGAQHEYHLANVLCYELITLDKVEDMIASSASRSLSGVEVTGAEVHEVEVQTQLINKP